MSEQGVASDGTAKTVPVVYLDDNFFIVNKPENVCIDGLDDVTLHKLAITTLQSKNIKFDIIRHCHQLDRATSGCLIYALNKKAAALCNTLFSERAVIKIYTCIVRGHIPPDFDHFFVDLPLTNCPFNPLREMVSTLHFPGRSAVTQFHVLKRGLLRDVNGKQHDISLLEVHLHTGRRHQIRTHLAHIGYPIIGDPSYSTNSDDFLRMYLHAERVTMRFDLLSPASSFRAKSQTSNIDGTAVSGFHSLIYTDIAEETRESNEPSLNTVTATGDLPNLVFPPPHSFLDYSYSLLLPYTIIYDNSGDIQDIKLLIRRASRCDMSPVPSNGTHVQGYHPRSRHLKGWCWNFFVEGRVERGDTDLAQTIAKCLQTFCPFLMDYLYCSKPQSTFLPSPELIRDCEYARNTCSPTSTAPTSAESTPVQSPLRSNMSDTSPITVSPNAEATLLSKYQYLSHTMGSCIRRGCDSYGIINCGPFVTYLVPIKPEAYNELSKDDKTDVLNKRLFTPESLSQLSNHLQSHSDTQTEQKSDSIDLIESLQSSEHSSIIASALSRKSNKPRKKNNAMRTDEHSIWVSLHSFLDHILCYGPIHRVTIGNVKCPVDVLLHYLLSNDSVQQWFQKQNLKDEKKEDISSDTLCGYSEGDNIFFIDYKPTLFDEAYSVAKKTVQPSSPPESQSPSQLDTSPLKYNDGTLRMKRRKKKKKSGGGGQRDNEPVKILDDIPLYLGSIQAAMNKTRLKELHITHILDCTGNDAGSIIEDDYSRLFVDIDDTLNDTILPHINDCYTFINKAVTSSNGGILIHCWQGASRSVSIVIAYLMKYHNFTLNNAFKHVQTRRGSFARPNTSFMLQLIQIEKEMYGENSYQVSEKLLARLERNKLKSQKKDKK